MPINSKSGTMNFVKKKSPKLVLLAPALLLIFTLGCQSAKRNAATTNPITEKAKRQLEASGNKQMEKEMRRNRTEGSLKQDAELTLKIMKENAPKVKLNEYFNEIAY